MRRIKITLSYDGGAYHGWQIQTTGLVTIQSVLEEVLLRIEKKPVTVLSSGRTDAGVHALAQTAAFSLENPLPLENLRRAMNWFLPTDIRILDVEEVHATFHPRFDAVSKLYEYRLFREEICPPFVRRYVHYFPYPLNETVMIQAAPILEGTHDFSAFAAADSKDPKGYSKVRTIFKSTVERQQDCLIYQVSGTGFLKHMVRNLVGSLIEVGKGNITPDQLRDLVENPSGKKGGPTVLSQGLFLISVQY